MDLAEVKGRRRTGNKKDGFIIKASDLDWLTAAVEQLTAERDRYMALVADAVDAKEAAEKMRDFYRTELAKRGCHDTFCEECGNRCSECTTNMMGTKEAK